MNNFDDDDDGGYYGGGCFHGDCTIEMHDGTTKAVHVLQKGDKISTSDDNFATIICIVKTKTWQGSARMCQLDGGLKITPGHPIKWQGTWIKPKSIFEAESVQCDYFYNLVVDCGHVARVNGVELILLGHGYTDGILKHDYLGSQRVIQDLQRVHGFDHGVVELQQRPDGGILRGPKEVTPAKMKLNESSEIMTYV